MPEDYSSLTDAERKAKIIESVKEVKDLLGEIKNVLIEMKQELTEIKQNTAV